jgi:hypothetical protein
MDSDIDSQHGSMADEGTRLDEGTRPRSDEESDDESEIDAGPQLEPRRPHNTESPVHDTEAADTTDDDSIQADSDPTLCGVQGLAERQLERQPFVIPYPNNAGQGVEDPAGARVRAQDHSRSAHANASYELEIAQDEMNPYTPFSSQLDWDLAKWAKLRGIGSTSFGELMAIPSVCTSPRSLVK